MILGTLRNASYYSGFGERVTRAIQYFIDHDPQKLPLGKNEIDGRDIYYEVSEVETAKKDGKLFEAHKNFIDIQMTLSGEEWYGHNFVENLKEEIPYDSNKDAGFYSGDGEYFQIPKGYFALFMPEDAHNPCVYFEKQGRVRKLVVKIRI